jgi:hypothetical protein
MTMVLYMAKMRGTPLTVGVEGSFGVCITRLSLLMPTVLYTNRQPTITQWPWLTEEPASRRFLRLPALPGLGTIEMGN